MIYTVYINKKQGENLKTSSSWKGAIFLTDSKIERLL